MFPLRHDELFAVEKFATSGEDRHAGRLFQPGDAVAELADHLVLAGEHFLPVGTDLSGDFDAEFPGAPRSGKHLRSGDEGFGRNAADVEAGAAEELLFHQGRFESVLPRPDRRHVAAGPGADHTNIEFFHFSSPG